MLVTSPALRANARPFGLLNPPPCVGRGTLSFNGPACWYADQSRFNYGSTYGVNGQPFSSMSTMPVGGGL